jgi:hypothetical protein
MALSLTSRASMALAQGQADAGEQPGQDPPVIVGKHGAQQMLPVSASTRLSKDSMVPWCG